MMIDSYLSVNLWTLFFFLPKHVITEHTIPYEVSLFVDIFCLPKLHQNTCSTFIWCNFFLFMTMAQSSQDLSTTMGPLVVRFYVIFFK